MIRRMLAWTKTRWLLSALLLIVAFWAFTTLPVAGTSSSSRESEISLVQETPALRLTPEFLKANGFREEGGMFCHDKMTLRDAGKLLGFSMRDLKDPYEDWPGHLAAHVDLEGGRCDVHYERKNIDFRDGKQLVWADVWLPSLQAAEEKDDLEDAAAPPPRVTAELLEANGFRKDNYGDYVRNNIAFQELNNLLQFSPYDMAYVYVYNFTPGIEEYRVKFPGGSCLLQFEQDLGTNVAEKGDSYIISRPNPTTPVKAFVSLKPRRK